MGQVILRRDPVGLQVGPEGVQIRHHEGRMGFAVGMEGTSRDLSLQVQELLVAMARGLGAVPGCGKLDVVDAENRPHGDVPFVLPRGTR